jgi:hypothetical protein
LRTQRRLACRVALDALILGDGEHKRGDTAPKTPVQGGRRRRRLLDCVVKDAGGDQMVWRADVVEHCRDLQWVQDERLVIGSPPLAFVHPLGVQDCRARCWERAGELRHVTLARHRREGTRLRKLREMLDVAPSVAWRPGAGGLRAPAP